ncbi:cyclic peptide export ABC transporter [Brevibacillus sp. 1238]|uniref:cyclic peptide export ABC transporter n=1 Tax=Brevibacillus sp. 1238 TaxID=2940565 RepID=UPI002475DAEE|nr:cyclic peptide export ABC transporter [Brevibacillus sp. 1238]MDH6353282.1 putative ATP-binding cassette transporter [Brevibacillus sp. 1238]
MRKGIAAWLVLLLLTMTFPWKLQAETAATTSLDEQKIAAIEAWIEEKMQDGKIPGVSVVIVKGEETIYNRGFGYADVAAQRPVTTQTLFELGSTSKAFTGLIILALEEQGLLSLQDPVQKYLPWFQMKDARGNTPPITLEQLLHHTSGIPFRSIGEIPAGEEADALERTVRAAAGQTLDFSPGEHFLYASINYDVLGLVVEKVTGKSFEQVAKDNVLTPLGMQHSYLFRQEAEQHEMAKGYKIGFLGAREYEAPVYRGNTPAGYIISNSEDMAIWLKKQLGSGANEQVSSELIRRSHQPDRSVFPGGDGSSYAAGWFVYQKGSGELSHGGSNPNYSSSVVIRPGEQLGVAVLTNINSAHTQAMGQGIMEILQGKQPPENVSDLYSSVDKVAVVILCIAIPLIAVTAWFAAKALGEIARKQRRPSAGFVKNAYRFAVLLVCLGLCGYCFWQIPSVLFDGLSWSFVDVWAPASFVVAILSLFVGIVLFSVYYWMTVVFPKANDRTFFPIIVLSTVSGLGNALIIFIINEALNHTDRFQGGLFSFFIMGILIYVCGQRLVRAKLITITNEMVFQKRTELIDKILNSPYQNIEAIEKERIYSVLNNDTETISGVSNILIFGVTSLVTLLCCFIYLGMVNLYGLLISIVVILVAAGLYFLAGRYANRVWEETRDIQNAFFKFINHMIGGFKELSIHKGKKGQFQHELQQSCDTYRIKRIQGDLSFANVFVMGELLFTFVIGVVAFIFPVVFTDIASSSLRAYIFVFLYMTGPVHGVLDAIPNFIRVRISWNRLNELSRQLEVGEDKQEGQKTEALPSGEDIHLEARAVEYHYKNAEGEQFTVGPVNLSFHSGQVTFITGGNGSGKSTLGKLLVGLYKPDRGELLVNGQRQEELGQHFAAIFSDFHLFEKLYGINVNQKEQEIQEYLLKLGIDHKLHIQNGGFSTVNLSTGQRKRLALLVSCMEDRPIYFFDEWAADQDPEFREYFYNTLLPEMKQKGKCVIAITHDDRYFHVADQLLKMEVGQIAHEHVKQHA